MKITLKIVSVMKMCNQCRGKFVIIDGKSVKVHSDEWIKLMRIRIDKKIWNNGHPLGDDDCECEEPK